MGRLPGGAPTLRSCVELARAVGYNGAMPEVLAPSEPVVRLENAFREPFNNAIATARTCYSSKVIYDEDVDRDEKARAMRDRIADSIYKAGHHTTLQHATFQFVLERVSRQFIWSFLHSHPFYNSEQVSQRYVGVKPGNYFVPPIEGRALALYHETVDVQMKAYEALNELLWGVTSEAFFKIFPARRRDGEKWKKAIQKKVQEVARYVLPVATFAHLYHTVSGITLHRYNKLVDQYDTPYEQKKVVRAMIEAVNQHDPLFFHSIEDPMPIEETPEFRMVQAFYGNGWRAHNAEFLKRFDAELGPHVSKLVDYNVNAERTLAEAVRAVLSLTEQDLSDAQAIEAVMNPAQNHIYGQALNLTTHSKLTRALFHAHYTFKKKLSHTADSQDQRHRMTPASRPLLFTQYRPGVPDFITPPLVQACGEAHDLFLDVMQRTWATIDQLLNDGVSPEFALYLLPNAFPIRFIESGDLLALHHKWTTRLCYNAQEEIWNACKDEVTQVAERHPAIARYILPPCGLRDLSAERPICPEGDRFCGVPVWRLARSEYKRLI